MKHSRPGRMTYREQVTASVKADAMYAALAGKPARLAADMPAPAKKRAAPKPSGKPLERDVLAEVIAALRAHPSVAWVCRMNSGTFKEGNRYIRANSQRGMSDVLAMTTTGKLIACEVKRPGGRVEPHQAEFLATIRANNGIAFVAYGAADVEFNLR